MSAGTDKDSYEENVEETELFEMESPPNTPSQGHVIEMDNSPIRLKDKLHMKLLNAGLRQRYHQDLDSLFCKIYQYFEQKGFWCFVLNRIYHCVTVLLTICVSSAVFLFIDWFALFSCKGVDCGNVSLWKFNKEYTKFFAPNGSLSIYVLIMSLIHLVLFLGWIVYLIRAMKHMYDMYGISSFIVNDLEISDKKLQHMTWNELSEAIVHFQNNVAKISVSELNQQVITNRIMRKDNYLIAFVNKEVFNLRPLPFMEEYLSESLLFSIHRIINHMFNGFKLDDHFVSNPRKLYGLFIFYGICNLLAAPFLVFFVVMNGIFRYAAALQNSHAAVLVERRWTHLAEWKFRDFNELPHIFQERMNKAYDPATAYLQQFPSHKLSILAKMVMITSSTLATVILILSVVKSDILLYVQAFGFNLFWWLGALLVVWSASRHLVIEKRAIFAPNEEMRKVVLHTQYLPEHWKGKAHTYKVRKEFSSFLMHTIWWFIYEVASILVTPWMLLYVLPQNAKDICKFLEEVTINDQGIGDICGLSSFDFENVNNIRNLKPGSVTTDKHVGSMVKKKIHVSKPLVDKMERSYIRFKMQHPHCSITSGDRMLNEIEAQQSQNSESSSPEPTIQPNPLISPASSPTSQTRLSETVALFDLLNAHSSLHMNRSDINQYYRED